MGKVHIIDFNKNTIFSKVSSKIRETIPSMDSVYSKSSFFPKNHPDSIVIDSNNHKTTQKNMMNNFLNKTVGMNTTVPNGLDKSIHIAHGTTKNNSSYPDQKKGVYK